MTAGPADLPEVLFHTDTPTVCNALEIMVGHRTTQGLSLIHI